MYLKINENNKALISFSTIKSGLVFSFGENIQAEELSEAVSVKLYSDDDMYLAEYGLADFDVVIKENTLYLKDKNFIEDVEGTKADAIQRSKELLATWLENNPMLYSDGKYYSVTEEKQSLLNSNLASYERATQAGIPYPLKWNSTGEECVLWEYTDLLTLSLTIAGYVAPKIAKQQQIEIEIKNCDSVDEINAIVIDYDTE